MVRTFLVVIMVAACAHPAPPAPPSPAPSSSAGKLTMKSYFLVLLRRGPAWSPEQTPESKKIKIQRLVPEVLTWYGPAGISYPGKLENPK